MNDYQECTKFANCQNNFQQKCLKCGESGSLDIIHAFKHLYEDKMAIIDREAGGDTVTQAKLNLQQDWINDLTEQNEILARAVEELEQEATQRVMCLEDKLKTSSECACEVINKYRDVSFNLETTFQTMDQAQSDIRSLVEFVRRIREDGTWSVDGLQFFNIQPEELMGDDSDNMLCACNTRHEADQDLQNKTARIAELEAKLAQFEQDGLSLESAKQMRQSMMDMRDALTAEVAEKHDLVLALRRDLCLLEEQCRKADQQTHFKDDIIKELRREIKQLKNQNNCSTQTTFESEASLVDLEWAEKRRSSRELIHGIYFRSSRNRKQVPHCMCYSQTDQNESTCDKKQSGHRLKQKPSLREFLTGINIITELRDRATSTSDLTGEKASILHPEDYATQKHLVAMHHFVTTHFIHNETDEVIHEEINKYEEAHEQELTCFNYDKHIEKCVINVSDATLETIVDEAFVSPDVSEFEQNPFINLMETVKNRIVEALKRHFGNNKVSTQISSRNDKGKYRNMPILDKNCNKLLGDSKVKSIKCKSCLKNTNENNTNLIKFEQILKDSNEMIGKMGPNNDLKLINPLKTPTCRPESRPSSRVKPKSTKSTKPTKSLKPKPLKKTASADKKSIQVIFNKKQASSMPVITKKRKPTPNVKSRPNKKCSSRLQDSLKKINETLETILCTRLSNNNGFEIYGKVSIDKKLNPYTTIMQILKPLRCNIKPPINKTKEYLYTSINGSLSDDTQQTAAAKFGNEVYGENYFITTISTNVPYCADSADASDVVYEKANTCTDASVHRARAKIDGQSRIAYDALMMKYLSALNDIEEYVKQAALDQMVMLGMQKKNSRLINELLERDKYLLELNDLVANLTRKLFMIFNRLKIFEVSATNIKEKERIDEVEDENDMLRKAILKAKTELDQIESQAEEYLVERNSYKERHQKSLEMIDGLMQDKIKADIATQHMYEENRNSLQNLAHNINILETTKSEYERKCLCQEETITSLTMELDLNKAMIEDYANKSQGGQETISQLQKDLCCSQNCNADNQSKLLDYEKQICECQNQIEGLQQELIESKQRSEELISIPKVYKTKSVQIDPNLSCTCQRDSQTDSTCKSKFKQFKLESDSNLSEYEEDSQPKSKKDHTELEGVISQLANSVSRMMVKHNTNKEAQKTRDNFESELAMIRNKDEIIKIQNDTLNIVHIELQALKNKDKEIEAERHKRKQEICNLRQTIKELEKSLKCFREQTHQLQRNVDQHLNDISAFETSQERNKMEISQQRLTITNLREALVTTKQQLQDSQQKSQNDLYEKSVLIQELWNQILEDDNTLMTNHQQFQILNITIESLRDLNLQLEVELHNNTQDVEMLESRLLKYQQDFTIRANECKSTECENKRLQAEKRDSQEIIEDLRIELAQCSSDLLNLQDILMQEQTFMEEECSNLTSTISELQDTIHTLQIELQRSEKELARELKINDINAQRIEELQRIIGEKSLEVCRWSDAAADLQQKLDLSTQQFKNQSTDVATLNEQLRNFEIANTIRDEHTDICQEEVSVCLHSLKGLKMKLLSESEKLNQKAVEFNNLQAQYCVQANEIENMRRELEATQSNQQREAQKYKNSLREHKERNCHLECQCQKLNEKIHVTQSQMIEAVQKDTKIQKDYNQREINLTEKLNEMQSEENRLLDVVAALEQQVNMLNCELDQKHMELEKVKQNICENNRKGNDEKAALKNEINCMVQQHNMLKQENEKLQMQLSKLRSNINKNDERNSMITEQLDQCICELQALQADKDSLMRKNDDLTNDLQQLQDVLQMKTNSVVTLEMELTDTRCSRDILCNESKNVVQNVKAWLQEQRRINKQLEVKIQNKNNSLQMLQNDNNDLKRDIGILEDTVHNLMQKCQTPSCTSNRSRQRGGQFIHNKRNMSSQSRTLWSIGSDSPPSSLNSQESEYDEYSISEEQEDTQDESPEIWINRVESLTDELQKTSKYWKTKLQEKDLIVSKDK